MKDPFFVSLMGLDTKNTFGGGTAFVALMWHWCLFPNIHKFSLHFQSAELCVKLFILFLQVRMLFKLKLMRLGWGGIMDSRHGAVTITFCAFFMQVFVEASSWWYVVFFSKTHLKIQSHHSMYVFLSFKKHCFFV